MLFSVFSCCSKFSSVFTGSCCHTSLLNAKHPSRSRYAERAILPKNTTRSFRFRSLQLAKSTQEGIPIELVEDPKFVPLNANDPRFGPPALLLLGFKYEDVQKVQQLLENMDGNFLKVLMCTEDMLKLSLWDAMHIQQTDLSIVEAVEEVPHICFLSGLNGEETLMFIDAFPETGIEPTVFAALVPNSAGKSIEELMEEIMGDHERLTGQQQRNDS